MSLETEDKIVKFRVSPSVKTKGVSLIGIQGANFIVVYNGNTITTPILGNDEKSLYEALRQFDKKAEPHIKDNPLRQNIAIDIKDDTQACKLRLIVRLVTIFPGHCC